MTNDFVVRARHWRGGWELHIDGEGVTQCRTLHRAGRQVQDYLETLHDQSFDDATITVAVELDGLENQIEDVKAETRSAGEAQLRAAAHLRALTRQLRAEELSVTDIASLLGVSRGRVSQLLDRDKIDA